MGARIAAHIANAGVWCALLDIAPSELTAEEQKRGLTLAAPDVRNRIVRAGLAAAVKAKPAAFFTRGLENRIVTGNFEDDLKLCAEADWIIEVVAENLEIKRALLSRVAAIRKPGTIVTTNTSGLPVRRIAEGMPEEWQQHWAGTHFFNPPRYLKLVEIIPGVATQPRSDRNAFGILRSHAGKRRRRRQGHSQFHRQSRRNIFHAECDSPDGRTGHDV